jgi:hypothetical protein
VSADAATVRVADRENTEYPVWVRCIHEVPLMAHAPSLLLH